MTYQLLFLFQSEMPGIPNISEVAQPPAGEAEFKNWAIYILILAIVGIVTMYVRGQRELKKSYEERIKTIEELYENRIKDKDKAITEHMVSYKGLQDQNLQLNARIAPALDASNDISKQILKFLQDESRKGN